MDYLYEHKKKFIHVINDLIITTHCHACGYAYHVSLLGYVGHYCSKLCWKDNEYYPMCEKKGMNDTNDVKEVCHFGQLNWNNEGKLEIIDSECKYCRGMISSNVISKYHRKFMNIVSWPMKNKECNNECIKNRQPVSRIK
jgi:hypothetical protein